MPKIGEWEKVSSGKWIIKNTRYELAIAMDGQTGLYGLIISGKNWRKDRYIRAETVEKARKIAVRWMREHPRG